MSNQFLFDFPQVEKNVEDHGLLAGEALRSFGRFFAEQMGLLSAAPYDPALGLLESRLVFELARAGSLRSKDLCDRLRIDKGYLSRIVSGLEARGILVPRAGSSDRREKWLLLSEEGQRLFLAIDAASAARSAALTDSLTPHESLELKQVLGRTQELLADRADQRERIVLRGPRPGDLGWVIESHGRLYHAEQSWDGRFEALVASIATAFWQGHDRLRERAWIAEAAGQRLGCVFLVDDAAKEPAAARLRLLLVEPAARGHGLGRRLVKECLDFARQAGYEKLNLWTNHPLTAARRLYESFGFKQVSSAPHHLFGDGLIGQDWSVDIPGDSPRSDDGMP